MKKMRITFVIFGFLSIFTWVSIGMAAGYPEKPIRMIIPKSAGGGDDIIARIFQPAFEKVLGQKILIENIPAGSSKVGTMTLMKAKPDGYTLLLATTESYVAYYYSGTFDSKVWEEMVPIGNVTFDPFGFVEVLNDSPFKSWADLVKAAKENPGKVTCGGPGGGMIELINNVITKAAGISTRYVPFAGGGPAKIALLGGHVDYRVCNPAEAIVMIHAGKTRGLAISTDKRVESLPNIPTFKELGIGGGIDMTRSIWGPPNLPLDMVNTITKLIEKATNDPEFIKVARDQLSSNVDYRQPEKIKEYLKNFDKTFGPELRQMYKK
jgi:tripartite-type tricarboxylate transporter receptor subunit TctC